METSTRVRSSLLEKALGAPARVDRDFFGNNRPPHGVDPQYLRAIRDTALRSRLIMAGLAEGLQSPKGPQKIASILRIYPDFTAPLPPRGRPPAGRPPSRRARRTDYRRSRNSTAAAPDRGRRARGLDPAARPDQRRHRAAEGSDRDPRGRRIRAHVPPARQCRPGAARSRQEVREEAFSASTPTRRSSRAATCG